MIVSLAWGPSSLVRSSAGDAQGQRRGAAVLDQPGDLVPVEAVGVRLGQHRGIPSRVSRATRQLCTSSISSPAGCVLMMGSSHQFAEYLDHYCH
jgi:hypothetical protein